jgi:hypothetical protein
MKWLLRLLVSSVAVSFVAGEVSAATPEAKSDADMAWSRATETDTLQAYAEFLLTYPESSYTEAAYAKLSAVSDGKSVEDTTDAEAAYADLSAVSGAMIVEDSAGSRSSSLLGWLRII